MSDSESDPPQSGEAAEAALFVERDDQQTALSYDNGGVPIYITVAWVVFIVMYVVVMSVLSLPDLLAWINR